MQIDKIVASPIDGEFNVVIEIPMNTSYIKYEVDKESGAMFVDRFMQTAMVYPCNYGFIPHTLSQDGDPIDVLVVCNYSVMSGSVVRSRPVGVLIMEDESGMDEKIIAVPVSKLDKSFDGINDISHLDNMILKRISHFFEHYKDLESGKWVKIVGFEGNMQALQIIGESIMRKNSF